MYCPPRRHNISITELAEMLNRYKEAPRSVYQKQLVSNGITPENAKKYADLLEDRGLNSGQKVDVLVKRMKVGKFPKIS